MKSLDLSDQWIKNISALAKLEEIYSFKDSSPSLAQLGLSYTWLIIYKVLNEPEL